MNLLEALKAVREDANSRPIPSSIEANLLAAFQEKNAKRTASGRPVVWAGLAFAASIAGIAVWSQAATVTSVERPPLVVKAPAAPEVQVSRVESVRPVPRPKRVRREPVVARTARPKTLPVVATEFVAVPYAPPFAPYDRGQLMRVRMPRQSLRTFGFAVNDDRWTDRVQADVLMGEDGIARAVRFVK